MKKEKLLTIGEFAKYSDRSITAIRYYEKLEFLKPVHIDKESGYRYYDEKQVPLLEVAQFCTELDIPLVELTDLIDDQYRLNSSELFKRARIIAENQLEVIQKKLAAIDYHEEQLERIKSQGISPNSTLIKMPKRYFFTIPFFETESILEYRKAILKTFKALNDLAIDDDDVFEFESGLYTEYNGKDVRKYFFVELPEAIVDLGDWIKIIPAGNYVSRFSKKSMVDALPNSGGSESFVAIETEAFSDLHDFNQPLWELKVLWVES